MTQASGVTAGLVGPAATVVVTRHPALVAYLREQGVIGADARIVSHAEPEDVRGQHVIGILPLHLAALAESVTEVELNVPPEVRGRELTLADVRQYARTIRRYRVREL